MKAIESAPVVEYPETDGAPMAETDVHRTVMVDVIHALTRYFEKEPDVYVSGNLLIYYVEGDPTKRVAPDVFVVRGVGKQPRRIYKLWEEGRPPDVVIELTSRQTCREDLQTKWRLYAKWGVMEYYLFDPEYAHLDQPLLAYRWENGEFQEVPVVQGRVTSEVLGLEFVDTGQTLRLYDPRQARFLPTPAEEAAAREAEAVARRQAEEALRAEAVARRQVEEALRAEAEARRRAEAEIQRLRRELERRTSKRR